MNPLIRALKEGVAALRAGRRYRSTEAPVHSSETGFVVTEGVESYWHYHISKRGRQAEALCGARTMHTSIRIDAYGKTPPNYHIPERWCARCKLLMDREITDSRAAISTSYGQDPPAH